MDKDDSSTGYCSVGEGTSSNHKSTTYGKSRQEKNNHGKGIECNAIVNKYLYKTLVGTEVRFLKVLPGALGDPVCCEMEHVSLNSAPRYTALSYVWGANTTGHEIRLNGHQFYIGVNLLVALDQLRSYGEGFTTRHVWVDAICINQNDIKERSEQVGRMTEVYGGAFVTIAWLGSAETLDEPYYKAIFEGLQSRQSLMSMIRKANFQSTDLCNNDIRRCLDQLIDDSWFCRVWTLQEGVLGDVCVVHLGPCSMSLTAFIFRLLSDLNCYLDYLDSQDSVVALNSLMVTKEVYDWVLEFRGSPTQTQEQNESVLANRLIFLLDASARRTCRERHDTVYGVLGLWKLARQTPLPELLEPNYNRSYADMCHQYSVYILTNTANLNIIRVDGPIRFTTVPSWVPDLGCLKHASDGLKESFSSEHVQLLSEGRELSATGYQCGYVVGTISCSVNGRSTLAQKPLAQLIAMFEKKVLEPSAARKCITIQEGRTSFILSLPVWNRGYPKHERERQLQLKVAGIYMQLYHQPGTEFHNEILDTSRSGWELASMAAQMLRSCLEYDAALLANGDILFADNRNDTVRPGDIIAIFNGGNHLALALRPEGAKFCLVETGHLDIQNSASWDHNTYVADKEIETFIIV